MTMNGQRTSKQQLDDLHSLQKREALSLVFFNTPQALAMNEKALQSLRAAAWQIAQPTTESKPLTGVKLVPHLLCLHRSHKSKFLLIHNRLPVGLGNLLFPLHLTKYYVSSYYV